MSVKQLASGKWQATYYYRIDGRLHKKKKSFGSKTEAKIWEQEGKVERRRNQVRAEHLELRTVQEMIDHYKGLADYATLAPSTKTRYDQLIKHFLSWCNENSIFYLSEWDSDLAKKFEGWIYSAKKKDKPLFGGRSTNHILVMVKLLFKFELARNKKAITEDPFKDIKLKKFPRKKPRFLQEHELEVIFLECDPFLYHGLAFLLTTGLRTKELIRLTWNKVTHSHILIEGDGEWKPKSFKGNRPIPLNTIALESIAYFRSQKTDSPYVLGKLYHEGTFYKRYAHLRARVLKEYNIDLKGTSIHNFRKTFGSILKQKGVPISEIADLLGHESSRTTEEIYAELLPENLVTAVDKLDSLRTVIRPLKS